MLVRPSLFGLFFAHLVRSSVFTDHDNEEHIYLPMLHEQGAMIPAEKMAKDHQQLMDDLKTIETIADGLLRGGTGSFFGGPSVQKEVRQLQDMIPGFVQSMFGTCQIKIKRRKSCASCD